MPNLSWKEITNVRSTSSVLSYEKDQRILTIQISNSYGQTLCLINMSPKTIGLIKSWMNKITKIMVV